MMPTVSTRRLGSQKAAEGFTMVELALCIAIVGIAVVAIIGVLPLGLNVQKENRDETIINQDAQFLMDAIREGNFNLAELTNYFDVIQLTSTNRHNRVTSVFVGRHLLRSLPDYTP